MNELEYTRGHFVWHELMTNDMDAAKVFYGELFGWEFKDVSSPSDADVYRLIVKDGKQLGGMMPLANVHEASVSAHWMGYVSIANIEETAMAAKQNGGTIVMEPKDIPHVGRLSVIRDPQHAYSAAIDMSQGDPDVRSLPPVGTFCWNQLNTTDPDGAAVFYQKIYGWTQGAFSEGGGKDMFVFNAGEVPVASMLAAPDGVPAHWLTYVVVDNLAEARVRVAVLGGTIMLEGMELPNVGTIAVAFDFEGTTIGLFEQLKK